MDRQQVIEGLNALCAAVRKRAPHVGAEVEAMTSDELHELHRLKSLLPIAAQEAAEARARINNSLTPKPLMIPKFTLAPLPVFKLQPLPFEPEYSPWFPLTKNPWQWGEYEIKHIALNVERIAPRRYLWDGREWADKLPVGAIAWRGLAKPPEVA